MPTQPYYVEGKRVPSVTTISSRFADKGGIIYWANQVGLGEKECDDQEACRVCGRKPGKRQYEAKSAAEVGTYAHALIDQKVKGTEVKAEDFLHLTNEQLLQAGDCLEAFDGWWDAYNVDIIETEMPLLSAKYRFGGTPDAIGRIGEQIALIDWKTSKGLYGDYICQLGGYLILLEENGYPPVDLIQILRVAKETAAFHHSNWPRRTFQPAIDHFLASRALYDLDKEMGKLLK
jgi:hypothetical protein